MAALDAKFIRTQSTQIINHVLKDCDIYHISSFKPDYISCEHNGPHQKYSSKIRWDFLYGNFGFINTINNFSSSFVRFCEYVSFGDYPKALRHKINIVSDLLEGDMKSFVPVHVSLMPYKFEEKEIDIETLSVDYSKYDMIVHPGFTRGVGSIFLNSPLKNVLLYVNKKHKLKIKQSNTVKLINDEEELVKHYTPLLPTSDPIYDFKIHKGNVKNMVKFHGPTETPVLKVNNIIDGTNLDNKPKQLHHTNFYKSTTFECFDNYCKVLFSNKVRLYTDKGNTDNLYNKFRDNAQKLQNSYFGSKFKHNPSKLSTTNAYEKIDSGELLGPSVLFNTKDSTDPKYNTIWERTFPYYKDTFKNSSQSFLLNNDDLLGGCKIEELDNQNDIDLVKKNEYKGIVIYVSKDIIKKLDRLFYELLYCVHFKVAISQTKCRGLKIINCNHKSWINSDKIQTKILNSNFLSYD